MALLGASGQLMLNAKEGMLGLRSEVGVKQETVERAKAERTSERETLDLARTKIVATDPLESASAYQTLETQLQTVYTSPRGSRRCVSSTPALRRCRAASSSRWRCCCSGSAASSCRASPRRPGSRIWSRSTGCAATTSSATGSSSGSTTAATAAELALHRGCDRQPAGAARRQRDRRADPCAQRRGGAGHGDAAAVRAGRRPDRRDGLGDRRRQEPARRHAGDDAAERRRRADLCGGAGLDHRERDRRRRATPRR